ncbi:uncharacterized protein LOC112147932 isoform X5 [Oryzias melastigma]|uniref:uncharacterized protein LOC112147932 isoform X5 n=1 Tax=Oryzias melastigma TaxID=30732 RepID=UPI00168D38D0|nr:uncharacterized protein LOC112147932 isoform X5 [Oryzias melastigma]
MTTWLYECLRTFGLEHHYARFILLGVCHTDHLLTLKIEDYPLLGICSMEDRIQLFKLVQFIKNSRQKSLLNNYECDTRDDDFTPINGKLSQNSRGAPDDKVRRKCRYSVESPDVSTLNVRRRLIFTDQNPDNKRLLSGPAVCVNQSHDIRDCSRRSNKSLQLEVDVRRTNYKLNDHSSLNDSWNKEGIKPEITGGIWKFNCVTIPTENSEILHTPAYVTPQTNEKTFKNKRKKVFTKKNNFYSDVTKSTPVHGAKSYSDIQPWSSPCASNKTQKVGQQITVCVRKRPLSYAERKAGQVDVVTATEGQCVIVHESKETVDLTPYISQHKFYFDHVFGEESSNEEVYQRIAYPLVQHMFRGGNATCFAYGQTGSGKTHTMLGSSPGTPGLYTLAVQDIFAHLTTAHSYPPLLVYVSFFEIYSGQLYDLLDHRKRLFAREDGQKVVQISGLREIRVDSVSSLLEVVSKGTSQRTQGVSGVNPLSSRSHALLQIQLKEPNRQTAGRMWFVDLAGSERASDAKERDKRRRMEGAEINQSLLALKECIRSLDKKASHTPFRQSRLTQVLKDSFVGDSMTCMIANISPGHSAAEHTLNTLRYADRVKELKRKGDVMEKRGRKTKSSHKQNLVHSNCSTASSPVKAELAKQSPPVCSYPSTSRLHPGGAPLHSTPKNNRCEEKGQAKEEQRFGFHHVRGRLGLEMKHQYKSADEEEGTGIKDKSADSCLVRDNTNGSVMVLRRQTEENQHVGEASCTACSKDELGFHNRDKKESHPWTTQGREEEEIQWMSPRIQWERSPQIVSVLQTPNERDLQRPDDEKKMHLRQYHQQLQQFVPSSVQFLSSSMCPNITSIPDSPCSSVETSVKHEICTNPNNRNDVDRRWGGDEHWGAALERINTKQYLFEKEKGSMTGLTQEARIRKEDSKPTGMKEEDQMWVLEAVTNRELPKECANPTSEEPQRSYHYDSDERRKVGVERLHVLCVPHNAVWSNRQRGAVTCLEDNSKQTQAEKPFSPSSDHTDTTKLLELQDNAEMAPLGHDRENKLCFDSFQSRKQCLDSQSTSKEEQNDNKTQINKTKISENLFFRQNPHCQNKDNRKKTVGKGFSHADVEEILGYKDKKSCWSLFDLPQTQTFHPTTCETVASADQTEQQNNTQRKPCGIGLNKPQLPGFRLTSFQHKEYGGKKQIETSTPCLQIPVKSPTIHVFPLEKLDRAKWCVAEAHMELLKGMGTLGLKEEQLLSQQSDMAFGEFVNKLEEIMERKIFLFCTYILLYILYMMTSVVSNHTRGTRDKTLPVATQTTQPQKQIQATAEQIRLAQVIYDKNDADFEDKVKQLIEVTGKTQDECMVALHDCNEDVNRAINFLLESPSDTNSWETVGKKRSLGKEGGTSEIKESREKRAEREVSRGRGGSNRRGRGISRGREGRSEENGFEVAPGERPLDRGRGGRGRGGRGRGRAAAGNRFSSQGMGTFNPADYTANSGARQENWEGDGNETAEGTGTWGGNLEDWTSEDWSEDLSETKVFTASSTPANHITPGHNADLASLLPKTGAPAGGSVDSDLGVIGDGPSADDLGQNLVFTNSHHNGRTATHSYAHATASSYAHAASASTTYAHAALSSVIGSGFGSLNATKQTPTPDVRKPEELNKSRLIQRSGNIVPTANNSRVSQEAGPPSMQNLAPSSSADIKPQRLENGPLMYQNLEMKLQPEPSAVLSQLTQRQQPSSLLSTTESLGLSQSQTPQAPTPPGQESSNLLARDGGSPGGKLSGLEPSLSEPPQRQLKAQRRRAPPPSKIPSSAVEMPGSADVPGLNVQFGALDFGSEAGSEATDIKQKESPREHASAMAPTPISLSTGVQSQQSQSSIFSKSGAVSEHMSSLPSAVSEPSFPSSSLGLPTASPSPSLGLPSAAVPSSSTGSRVDNSAQRSLPPHLSYPQSKDVPSAASASLTMNGFAGIKTQSAQETTASVKTESAVMTSESSSGHHVPSPAVTPSHSAPISSLSSLGSGTHSTGPALVANSSLTQSEGSTNLHAFSSSSSQVINPNASAPPVVSSSSTNGLHQSGAPGLSSNGTNSTLPAAGSRTAPLLTTTSGKAPPNLAQGVPPLLANQYIMGPGGLLPAYPQIYGYEDLQMLQSRLPLQDYYGVTFPGAAAPMPGRDGLANNPYSGEATKFGRNDSSSPAPPTSLSTVGVQSQPQQTQQTGTQGQPQTQGQQTQNQAFLNPPLPPGYGYPSLPYYAGMPGVPSAFQYTPAVFVPPSSAKQPTMGLANPTSQYHQQHQPSYGQHAYSTAFDDLSQAHGGEFNKAGYGSSAQSQPKSAGSGQGKDDSAAKSLLEMAPGLTGSGTSSGVPDMGGSIYSKTQPFDKQGFHTGTPPPFNLPSAMGGTGPMNPGGAPGYPGPFLHILPPHQQPHSQLLHHHLTQDGQGGPGQRSQSSGMQQKTQGSKSSYGSSPYWAN